MKITEKVQLENNIYYVIVDVEYRKNTEGKPVLCLQNWNDDYWDGGDCSELIDNISKEYSKTTLSPYFQGIHFLADVLYIYDRIPFLSGIKITYISSVDKSLIAEDYISKEELDKYIKTFNIKMHDNSNFKLYDSRTWYIEKKD